MAHQQQPPTKRVPAPPPLPPKGSSAFSSSESEEASDVSRQLHDDDDGAPSAAVQNPADLTRVVDELLGQMQTRFRNLGQNITSRMEEMGTRLDGLESAIEELMEQAGLERSLSQRPAQQVAQMHAAKRPSVMEQIEI